MGEAIETVIVGAGHAGLSTSYFLKQRGLEHVVLEKADRPGNAWRSERWDSFTFVSPNWTFQLPGGEYDGPDPDGFMTRSELIGRFDRYVDQYQLPVLYNTCVTAIAQAEGGGFVVRASGADGSEIEYRARNVVAANGWFQVGKRPSFTEAIPPEILQLQSGQYRNPQALPPGAVLVVGAGQSGAQIAEELYQSGRRVFLATGVAPHAPRRYRGRDLFHWLVDSGWADQTFEQMSFMGHALVAPLVSGKDGGHALNLHKFYREGVILLGHARDCQDGTLVLAPDLQENLARSDGWQRHLLGLFDRYIEQAGLDAPPPDAPDWRDAYQSPERTRLDLRAEGVSVVIWACGYRYDASMFTFPVLNQYHMPEAPLGVCSACPGLFFNGFPFQPVFKTGFFPGVARAAQNICAKITEGHAVM